MQRSKQLDIYKPTITKWINDSLAASRAGGVAGLPTGAVPWSNVSKAGSSIADLESHSHGLLTDLDGDHHTQYLHLNIPRTVNVTHTFAAGLTSPDADSQFVMGRALVGAVGWPDYAGFAHRDWATQGGYALLQGGSGEVILNAPPGQTISHRFNNANAAVMTSSELTMHSAAVVRSNSFTSGFTGNGWRIDNGVLTAGKTTGEIDDLIVRGRMRVYELLVQQIRATNGSIFVSSTGKVKTVTGAGPYSIETETTHGFLVNDLIRSQRFTGNGVYQSNLQVTAVADTTHFTATLSSGDAPAAGMEFVRLGNTSDASRQNSIYMSADDTYNPFIDLIVGVNSFAAWGSTATRKGRIGNLQGLFATPNELGIFVGDGTGVTNKYMRVSNITQESHNIPNRMYDGSGNLFLQMDTSGLNFYVQPTGAFVDNTSILFRRPDGTKILQLVASNSVSGGHQSALTMAAGSSDSNMSIVSAAPVGKFSLLTLQNTVGGLSSQWLFKRLANGTVGADFPGYLYVDGNVGIGTASPEDSLHVTGGIRVRNGSVGFVTMRAGDASNIGYLEWYKPAGTRIGYMGHAGTTNLNVVLENSAALVISGGETQTADILVSGVARFSGGYIGIAEQAAPATSAIYGYLYIDSADGDLKVKFKNGVVKTLATN